MAQPGQMMLKLGKQSMVIAASVTLATRLDIWFGTTPERRQRVVDIHQFTPLTQIDVKYCNKRAQFEWSY